MKNICWRQRARQRPFPQTELWRLLQPKSSLINRRLWNALLSGCYAQLKSIDLSCKTSRLHHRPPKVSSTITTKKKAKTTIKPYMTSIKLSHTSSGTRVDRVWTRCGLTIQNTMKYLHIINIFLILIIGDVVSWYERQIVRHPPPLSSHDYLGRLSEQTAWMLLKRMTWDQQRGIKRVYRVRYRWKCSHNSRQEHFSYEGALRKPVALRCLCEPQVPQDQK